MRGRRVLAGNENAVLHDVGLRKKALKLALSHIRTTDQERAYQPRLRGLLEQAAEFHDARLDEEGDLPELALQPLLVVRESGGLAALEKAHALRVGGAREGDRTVAHGGGELARAKELSEHASAYPVSVSTHIRTSDTSFALTGSVARSSTGPIPPT